MKFNLTTLGDVCIGKGEYGIGASAVPFNDELYRYIRITDINENGTVDENKLICVDDDNACKYLLEKNDICFARTGNSTGKSYFYDGTIKNLVFAGFLIRFKLNPDEINPKYMKYYTLTQQYKNWVSEIQTGSTRGNINANMYGLMPLRLPNIEYQNKMVHLLDKINYKIEENNYTNDNLHGIAKNMFLNIYNTGTECKLEDLIHDIQSGSREKGGAVNEGIPSIGAEKIERIGIYNYSNEKYISENFFKKMKKGIVKSGDVLLYKDGAYTGKVSMALNEYPHKECAINEHVFILRTKDNFANYYLYFLLNYDITKQKIMAMAQSKAAQPGLNQVEIKSTKVNIPNKESIIEFERNVKPLMEKLIENSKENKILTDLRDTLLPKLMNGEIYLENIEI